MMSSTCYEVAVRFRGEQVGAEEALKKIFHRLGFCETSLIVTTEGRYVYLKVFCERRRQAFKLVEDINDLHLHGLKVSVRVLGVSDWRDKWKEGIKPFVLTPRLDVVPSWQLNSYRPTKRKPIVLDTTLAFGTGLHETTRFSSNLIEKCSGKFKTFLDIGTGTGLLTMVASHCGATELCGVDIDLESIPTAKQNLAKNGMAFDWCRAMDFRQFRQKKKFDLVAANVVTDELIDMRARIVSVVKPGGYLILSGISLANLTRLKVAFSDQPLRCLRILKGKKWTAVLYKKQMLASSC